MVMDEARTAANTVAEHVEDHNLLHARYNLGVPVAGAWGPWIDVDTGVGFEGTWENTAIGDRGLAEYRKHSDGMVQTRGTVRNGVGKTIFYLPPGYRPPVITNWWGVDASSSGASIQVLTSGAFEIVAGNHNSVHLYSMWDSTGGA